MATVTLKGTVIQLSGELPAVGSEAPDAVLTGVNLADGPLSQLRGKWVLLNIFPSIDTPTCAASVRRFNEEAGSYLGVAVVCVSADLPFAHKRFCGAEGIERVASMSSFRHAEFGERYGVTMLDGPLKGLLARAVVVVDASGIVRHAELVPEVSEEPDYAAAMAAL
ncbi:MAG: thiol peroxidase [Candidatus Sericytochromatia bacterium]|nr:thiol peroxidase [Candidatus Sericytochromatia bacterium]